MAEKWLSLVEASQSLSARMSWLGMNFRHGSNRWRGDSEMSELVLQRSFAHASASIGALLHATFCCVSNFLKISTAESSLFVVLAWGYILSFVIPWAFQLFPSVRKAGV